MPWPSYIVEPFSLDACLRQTAFKILIKRSVTHSAVYMDPGLYEQMQLHSDLSEMLLCTTNSSSLYKQSAVFEHKGVFFKCPRGPLGRTFLKKNLNFS